MVLGSFKKIILLYGIIFYSFLTNAQNEELRDFDYFAQYSNWGFSAAKVSYLKPVISRNNVADISVVNSKGAQISVKYLYHKESEWSFNTGMIFTLLQPSKVSFSLKNQDVFQEEQRFFESKLKGQFYVQIPISAEIKKRLWENVYFNFNAGATLFFIDVPTKSVSYTTFDASLNENKEVFSLDYNNGNTAHLTALFSTGVYIMFRDFMIQTNIIFDKTFEDFWGGDYQFKNLLQSEPSSGTYNLKGDYFGVSLTVYLKRKGW